MANGKIRVRLRAFDVELIDQSAKSIVQTVQKAGAKVSGPIPLAEQVAKMQEIAPACEIDTSVFDPTTGNWRITGYIKVSLPLYADAEFEQEVFHPRYYLLQEQFGYQDQDFAFARNDPLY